ncbi:MAG: methylated-DNA--[protein]-cysteine S-methyltransferase [Pseudomonadota bacterium]
MTPMTPAYNAVLDTPCVRLGVQHNGAALISLDFIDGSATLHNDGQAFTLLAIQELRDYFANPRRGFSMPLHTSGTPFQQRVWRALQQIDAGRVITYGELAAQLKSGPRAIASACRANPIPIVIPCHRVVARNGLGGYSGARAGEIFAIKPWLLRHEGAVLR